MLPSYREAGWNGPAREIHAYARAITTGKMDPMPAHDRIVVARSLATDAAGAEVLRTLDTAGVIAVLLKGATVADWLYPGEARPYVDTDVLVAPTQAAAAADVLVRLGFVPYPRFVSPHAHPWQRAADGAEIDLHITVWGPHRTPEALWRELQAWLMTGIVAGVEVRVPTLPARALLIVLHAAQHRANLTRPREDLRRALAFVPKDIWREAERLGDRLWALGEMADGLMLDPSGAALLQELPLARAAATVNRGGPPLAVGLARLRHTRGAGAKLAVAVRAFAPPELGDPRGTQAGDDAAGRTYAGRAGWLLARIPGTVRGAYRAWRTSRITRA